MAVGDIGVGLLRWRRPEKEYVVLGILQIAAVLVLSVALSLSLAHALELPGKMRLSENEYYAVQQIYYPGFTYGGASEPIVILLLVVVLLLGPAGALAFWLTAFALLATAAMQAVYWLVTHPVNQAWVKGLDMSGAGKGFFALGARPRRDASWMELRDRWEYSHVLRAILAFAGLAALIVSLRYSS